MDAEGDAGGASPSLPGVPCYACARPATSECTNCDQPFCTDHQGIEPRLDWCAECVRNAKHQEALGWTYNGCGLGCLIGVVVWVVILVALPAAASGPGRGFVVVVGIALLSGLVAYVLRYRRLLGR
jgi:hypothetical protein